MGWLDVLRTAADEVLGNRGAIRNCRVELERRAQVEEAVARLTSTLAPAGEDRRPLAS